VNELKISMGIWGINNLPDRFNTNGFGEYVPVLERIRLIGETEGIDGIELHVPTEIDQTTKKEIKRALEEHDLRIVQLCGHTWTEKQYAHGALADLDNTVRGNAVARVKEALDMGAEFEVPISVLWPATDGSDFPLQSNYSILYSLYVDSIRQIMEYVHRNGYSTKVCLEPKPFEPRSRILFGTTGQALCLANEIDDPSFGINIDIGHSLIAGEYPEDQIALVCRYGRLFHTHFDDNDQQADIDVPPGTINMTRLISIMYILDSEGYDGWYGLDLFPYRDDPLEFMKLAVENLRYAGSVAALIKDRGGEKLRSSKGKGPQMAALIRNCMREV